MMRCLFRTSPCLLPGFRKVIAPAPRAARRTQEAQRMVRASEGELARVKVERLLVREL